MYLISLVGQHDVNPSYNLDMYIVGNDLLIVHVGPSKMFVNAVVYDDIEHIFPNFPRMSFINSCWFASSNRNRFIYNKQKRELMQLTRLFNTTWKLRMNE